MAAASVPDTERQIVKLPDGQRVGFAVYGDPAGLPVLSLHGSPATRLMFKVADREAREAGLKLIAPDRPGYGLTPLDTAPTLASRAAGLEALADALGLERFAILGISGGAPFATALAARVRDRATVLALVSPVGPISELEAAGGKLSRGHHGFFVDMPLNHPTLLSGVSQAGAAAFRWAPHLSLKSLAWSLGGADHDILIKPHVEEAMIAMTSDALSDGIEGGIADLDMFARPWGLDWGAITAPTLIWQGAEDVVVPPAASEYIASHIRGARLWMLPDAGHFWIFDHIPEVLAALKAAATATPAHAKAVDA